MKPKTVLMAQAPFLMMASVAAFRKEIKISPFIQFVPLFHVFVTTFGFCLNTTAVLYHLHGTLRFGGALTVPQVNIREPQIWSN